MIVNIANPIYDSVFKYLMEDERIAKTILSALLKVDVVSVEARPHEYTNQTRDMISMFRIDFSATIREKDNTEHLILVELQKTWLETETLRFRQYLGAQYSDKRNIRKDKHGGYAIPMVAIYILGHRLGNVDEPIVYVSHKSYDYEGREITKGMPDPFIESLTHNSIIVQIPLLHGQVNNHLEKVLTVFDQTKVSAIDPHVLNLDEEAYRGDNNMEYILKKLTEAAANAEMRQDMNVEDEYFSAIEDRDTAIMKRDQLIQERNQQLQERDQQLQERDQQLQEKNLKISEQDNKISEQSSKIRSLIMALKEKGMPTIQISKLTGLPENEIDMMV